MTLIAMVVCRRFRVALVLLLALAASPLRAQPVPPVLAAYAALASTDVSIRRGAQVASGAVGAVSGTARLGRDVRVSGTLAAPSVQLARRVRTRSLFCHLVSGPAPLPGCMAFTDPLIDPAVFQPVAVVPGSADLVLRAGTGTAPVPPGSFRDVRVGSGALLQLAGGTYSFRSLRIGARGRVVCVDACVIGVLDTVRLKRRAWLGAEIPARAGTVRVDVAAIDGQAFVARPRANVAATIFAPGAGVVLGPRGSYRGAFIGATITVGAEATVRADSAL